MHGVRGAYAPVLLKPALQASSVFLGVVTRCLRTWLCCDRPFRPEGALGRPQGRCFVGSTYLRVVFRPEGSCSDRPVYKQLNSWVTTRLQPVSSTAFKPASTGEPLAEADG